MGNLDSKPQKFGSRALAWGPRAWKLCARGFVSLSLVALGLVACNPPSECWHTASCPPPPDAGMTADAGGGATEGATGARAERADAGGPARTSMVEADEPGTPRANETDPSNEVDASSSPNTEPPETDSNPLPNVPVPFIPLLPPIDLDALEEAGVEADASVVPSLLALKAVAREPSDPSLLEAIEPPFAPKQREYRLEASFWLTDVAFELAATDDSVLTLNGNRIAADSLPWVSLELGDNVVELDVRTGSETTSYTIVVHRRPPIQLVSPIAGNRFGHAIAAFQDLLLVGAPHVGTTAGYVFAFRREGPGNWVPSNQPLSGDPSLGTAVAFDGSTLMVGADGETAGGEGGAGAVHFFSFDGDSFHEQVVSSFDESIKFRRNLGINVAVFGNWAAATTDNSNEVYTYTRRSDGLWSEDVGSPLGAADGYAFIEGTVSMAGNWLLVGSHNTPEGGAVFVYQRGINGWAAPAIDGLLHASGMFADSVALVGRTFVVNGEPVRVFERSNDDTWSHRPLPVDSLGPVTLTETLLVVGSQQDPFNTVTDDQVFVFRRNDGLGTWQLDPNAPLPTDRGVAEEFGYSVAAAAGRVFVGAPGELPGGAVYIYD